MAKEWKSKASKGRAKGGLCLWSSKARQAMTTERRSSPSYTRTNKPTGFQTREAYQAGQCMRCSAPFQAGDQVLPLGSGLYWCQACCEPR
jgi:hypothetical protein